MTENLKKKLQKSPFFNAVIAVVTLIVIGVFSNAFITEISVNSELHWMLFYKKKSFYFLCISGLFIYLYYRFLHSSDDSDPSIDKFMDDEYCKAYMRKECLPQLAKRINKLIKSGKPIGEVKDALRDLNL